MQRGATVAQQALRMIAGLTIAMVGVSMVVVMVPHVHATEQGCIASLVRQVLCLPAGGYRMLDFHVHAYRMVSQAVIMTTLPILVLGWVVFRLACWIAKFSGRGWLTTLDVPLAGSVFWETSARMIFRQLQAWLALRERGDAALGSSAS